MTAEDLFLVLSDRTSHGLEDGVWYLLRSPPVMNETLRKASLCSRFGLEQKDLEKLLAAHCPNLFAAGTRGSAWRRKGPPRALASRDS